MREYHIFWQLCWSCGAIFADTTEVQIERADFTKNKATILDQFGGGAIVSSYAKVRVGRSNFTENIALSIINSLYGLGGAVFGCVRPEGGHSSEYCQLSTNKGVSGGLSACTAAEQQLWPQLLKQMRFLKIIWVRAVRAAQFIWKWGTMDCELHQISQHGVANNYLVAGG
jgi:hypothetical protein